MQELTGVSFNLGEQNKDMVQARQACDWKDIQTLLSYLQERSPITSDPSLQSICTGLYAHSTVSEQQKLLVMPFWLAWTVQQLPTSLSSD